MDSKLKYVMHCYICTNMLKQIIVNFVYTRAGPYRWVAGGQLQGGDLDHGHGVD